MNYIKILAVLFFFGMMGSSCESENMDDIITEEEEQEVEVTECDTINVILIEGVDPQTSETTISVVVAGGTAPYSFEWSTGENTNSIVALATGTYTVTLTDAEGCTGEGSIDINITSDPCEEVLVGKIRRVDNVTLTAEASGGNLPYAYEWSTGETTQSIQVQGAGTYAVTITEATGCTVIAMLDANDLQGIITESPSGTLTVVASGGTPAYTYWWWATGETTNVITVVRSGTYTVTIKDSEGYTFVTNILVTIDGDDCSSLEISASINANALTGTVSGTGGTPPYSYLWSTEENTSTISIEEGVQYSVTLTDANNCSRSTGLRL